MPFIFEEEYEEEEEDAREEHEGIKLARIARRAFLSFSLSLARVQTSSRDETNESYKIYTSLRE